MPVLRFDTFSSAECGDLELPYLQVHDRRRGIQHYNAKVLRYDAHCEVASSEFLSKYHLNYLLYRLNLTIPKQSQNSSNSFFKKADLLLEIEGDSYVIRAS